MTHITSAARFALTPLRETQGATPWRGVTLGSVTGLVAGLVERDLLRRDEEPADRRQKLARLTPKAQARLRRMERERSVVATRLLRRMPLDDLRALRQGLVALATAGASVPARSSTHRSPKEL